MADTPDVVRFLELVLRRLETRRASYSIRDETNSSRITAVLIWYLGSSTSLAKVYMASKGSTSLQDESAIAEERCALTLTSWLLENEETVILAMSDLENPLRMTADAFLVRSLVAQYIMYQNTKGLTVQSREAIDLYLRLWYLRPVPEAMKPILLRLTHHRNTRRKWRQLLRKEWMFDIGQHSVPASLPDAETAARVFGRRIQSQVSHNFSRISGRHDVLQRHTVVNGCGRRVATSLFCSETECLERH